MKGLMLIRLQVLSISADLPFCQFVSWLITALLPMCENAERQSQAWIVNSTYVIYIFSFCDVIYNLAFNMSSEFFSCVLSYLKKKATAELISRGYMLNI